MTVSRFFSKSKTQQYNDYLNPKKILIDREHERLAGLYAAKNAALNTLSKLYSDRTLSGKDTASDEARTLHQLHEILEHFISYTQFIITLPSGHSDYQKLKELLETMRLCIITFKHEAQRHLPMYPEFIMTGADFNSIRLLIDKCTADKHSQLVLDYQAFQKQNSENSQGTNNSSCVIS